MVHLRGPSSAASYQHIPATVAERKYSPPARFSTCELRRRAAVLAATEPRDHVCCMIGCVSHKRVSGPDRYSAPELGFIFEASDLSGHSPDRGLSDGGMNSNMAFLWGLFRCPLTGEPQLASVQRWRFLVAFEQQSLIPAQATPNLW